MTSAPEASDFAVSARVRAGTSAVALHAVGPPGCHVQLAYGQPVAVGRGQGQPVAVDLDPDAGEHRQRVVAAGGDRDLRDGRGERVGSRQCPEAAGISGSVG